MIVVVTVMGQKIPKIADRTLTMRQVIILTTDIKITATMDISEQNEVFNFSSTSIFEYHSLAGMSLLKVSNSVNKSRLDVLRFVISLVAKKTTEFENWVFVGNSAWQPDTRIIRHRKLWGALRARGVSVTHASDAQEAIVERGGKLKFFGAKKFSELSAESVIKTIGEEQCAYLLVLPEKADVKEMLRKGWSAGSGFDETLLEFAVEKGGIVLKAIGEFDDVEAGFVAIGHPKLVKSLLK